MDEYSGKAVQERSSRRWLLRPAPARPFARTGATRRKRKPSQRSARFRSGVIRIFDLQQLAVQVWIRIQIAVFQANEHTAAKVRPMNLYALSDAELAAQLKTWGVPKFRLKQIKEFLYGKHPAESIDDMHTLPKALRAQLSTHATLGEMTVAQEQSGGATPNSFVAR